MNKSNEYKKYFDNVSPDQELVNRTRNMMLSELRADTESGTIRKISYKKYGMIAVCAAAAAVTIIVSPKIGSRDNKFLNKPEINNSAEVTSVSENSNHAEITSVSTDMNSMSVELITSSVTSVSDQPLLSSADDKTRSTEKLFPVTSDLSVDQTRIPAVSSVPESSAANSVQVTVPSKAEETVISSETMHSEPEVSVSVIPNFRPGVTSSSEITYTSGSATHSTDGAPDAEPPSVDTDYVETVKAVYNGKEYPVYLNMEYDFDAPHIMDKDSISIQNAENYFGNDFWPSFSEAEKTAVRIFVSDADDPGSGIYFVAGKQTSLSERNSKFAAVSVSDNGTELRYSVPYEYEAVPTVIDSCNVVFWKLVQYDDVYICSYMKNEHKYDICFKGYSINDITEVIMN